MVVAAFISPKYCCFRHLEEAEDKSPRRNRAIVSLIASLASCLLSSRRERHRLVMIRLAWVLSPLTLTLLSPSFYLCLSQFYFLRANHIAHKIEQVTLTLLVTILAISINILFYFNII